MNQIPRSGNVGAVPGDPSALGQELIYTSYSNNPTTMEIFRDFRRIDLQTGADAVVFQAPALSLSASYRAELIESPFNQADFRYKNYMLAAKEQSMLLMNSSGKVVRTLPINANYFSFSHNE